MKPLTHRPTMAVDILHNIRSHVWLIITVFLLLTNVATAANHIDRSEWPQTDFSKSTIDTKEILSGVHFAFAWLAFRPNSDIYQFKNE